VPGVDRRGDPFTDAEVLAARAEFLSFRAGFDSSLFRVGSDVQSVSAFLLTTEH
jgi:hypothetical protein